MNRLLERCLRIIYNDKRLSFEEVPEKDSSASIQYLAAEMYKVSNGLFPPLFSDIFNNKNSHPCNLQQFSVFETS